MNLENLGISQYLLYIYRIFKGLTLNYHVYSKTKLPRNRKREYISLGSPANREKHSASNTLS